MEDLITIDTTAAGRAVTSDDVNTWSKVAALADDRVLQQLFHLAPFDGVTVSKGVLAFAPIVTPGSSTRTVLVDAFRALVGSRTAASIGDVQANTDNYRDIRSALHIGAGQSGAPFADLFTISANTSGNPRIDVCYAAVIVDGHVTAARYQKDKLSKTVSAANVTTKLQTTIQIRFVQGTPAASPVAPSIPSDGVANANGGVEYYVKLAEITVADGATTFSSGDINNDAPQALLQVPLSSTISAALVTGSLSLLSGAALIAQVGSTSTWAIGSTFNVHGTASFDGSTSFSGTTTLGGKIAYGYRTVATDATLDGTRTITIADGPVVDGSAITAGRSWTLSTTGASHGQTITIVNNNQTNAITLHVTLPAPIGATTISIWRNPTNTWSETFIYDSGLGLFQQLSSSDS